MDTTLRKSILTDYGGKPVISATKFCTSQMFATNSRVDTPNLALIK